MDVYCSDCNTWICKTTHRKGIDIYRKINLDDLNENVTMRKFSRAGGALRMTCAKCGTLLFNGAFPRVEGQFDLVNANYCPVCGRELI